MIHDDHAHWLFFPGGGGNVFLGFGGCEKGSEGVADFFGGVRMEVGHCCLPLRNQFLATSLPKT